MSATTVRISPKGHALLRRLATASEASMSEVLDQALETYRRQKFLEEAGAAYDTLRRDPQAWKKHQSEMSEWEATLGDGLKSR
jgi:predicted transcriptional regulator